MINFCWANYYDGLTKRISWLGTIHALIWSIDKNNGQMKMNYTLSCICRWFLLVLSQDEINGLIKMNLTRHIICNHNAYYKLVFDKMAWNGTSEISNIDNKILTTFGPICKWHIQKEFWTMCEWLNSIFIGPFFNNGQILVYLIMNFSIKCRISITKFELAYVIISNFIKVLKVTII
jgi:hypothetical protein